MKFIRKFESYNRKTKKLVMYLDEEDEKLLENFLNEYIDNKKVLLKVKKLKFEDISDEYNFSYTDIFDNILNDFKKYYQEGTIYYDTDKFIYNNNIKYRTSFSIRNSMSKIIDNYWLKIRKEFSKILDNKLIKYFNKHHDEYKDSILFYGDNISDYVKKECQYIIDHEKYNL